MENILSITETEPITEEISIQLDSFSMDAFGFIEQEYPDTTLNPECYQVDYRELPQEIPDWVKDLLKESAIKKLFYKAGIATFSKEAIASIRHRIYMKLKTILVSASAMREYHGGKVIRRSHIEAVFDHGDCHYIYEN